MKEHCDESEMCDDDALRFVPGDRCPYVLLDAAEKRIAELEAAIRDHERCVREAGEVDRNLYVHISPHGGA
jgi:hypothetical protein